MPVLLLPAALAALAAIVVPLIVHLARRSEAQPVDFPALRWLRERPVPRRRPRFDERLLLAVRLLLIALVALWLARPALTGSVDERAVVAVMPGLARPVVAESARGVWLAPGFPPLDQPSPPAPARFATLLRQLDAELAPAAALRVVVPAVLDGADAERPHLSRRVDWRTVPGAMRAATPTPAGVPALIIRAPAAAGAVRYLRAAARSWIAPGKAAEFAVASPEAPIPAGARYLVWLAPGPLPAAIRAWIDGGGTALVAATTVAGTVGRTVYWRDDVGAALVEGETIGRGRLLRFTRPLTPAAMPQLLDPDFPHRLRGLFSPSPAPPGRVLAADYAPSVGAAPFPQPARDLQPWLALLIAAVAIAERGLATRRRRGIAA